MKTALDLLLDQMQKLDNEIKEADRAHEHLTKQAGAKLQKISLLKEERSKLSAAYKELANTESTAS